MKPSSISRFSALYFRTPLLAALMAVALGGCSSLGLDTEGTYENKGKKELYKHGSVLSDEGGTMLFGGDEKKKTADALGLGVNGYLWRATLDTIAFMPIAAADPFGGVITTDWYSAPDAPNERAKLNVLILDRELRADGVKVSVFRQTRGVSDAWNDAPVAPTTASQIEETILTRARQMRLAQKEGAGG